MSKKEKSYLSIFLNGIIKENPVLILILGTCPTLAMSTDIKKALGMGLATAAVLICSNIVISLLRKIIPDTVRIPCYIVVIAGFVTIVDLIMHAYLPELHSSIGTFLQLITVNCIILGRAEMFASKNSAFKSALDGLGMGLGFTLALLSIATIREVLGNASFAGYSIPFLTNYKIEFFAKAPGGMVVYGLMIALIYKITKGKGPKKKSFSCEGCPSAAVCLQKGACNTDEQSATEQLKEENANV